MKRKISPILVIVLMVAILAGLNIPVAAAAGSSQTFYFGDSKFGATITFPTFLGTTEVNVPAKYGAAETVKKSYPVVSYPGEGNPWYYINDVKGALKDLSIHGQQGLCADCYGISFQLNYWYNGSLPFGDDGREVLAEFYSNDQLDALGKSNAFISYPGQYGAEGFVMTDDGIAASAVESGMGNDPYIHYFNMDIGSTITTAAGESLGESVLVIPESTIGKYSITSMTGSAPTYMPATAAASKTTSTVRVNGVVTAFDAYKVGGNNYFKLRDIAKVLSGSPKQFEVTWDGNKKAINLLTGKAYTVVGGEMAQSSGEAQVTVTLNTASIYLDGTEIVLTAYTFNNNNYIKLRDLGKALNFGVDWDGATSTIFIDSSKAYSE